MRWRSAVSPSATTPPSQPVLQVWQSDPLRAPRLVFADKFFHQPNQRFYISPFVVQFNTSIAIMWKLFQSGRSWKVCHSIEPLTQHCSKPLVPYCRPSLFPRRYLCQQTKLPEKEPSATVSSAPKNPGPGPEQSKSWPSTLSGATQRIGHTLNIAGGQIDALEQSLMKRINESSRRRFRMYLIGSLAAVIITTVVFGERIRKVK